MRAGTVLAAAGLVAAGAAGVAPAATASGDRYLARKIAEPAARGVTATGPLAGWRATPSARLVVRQDWPADGSTAAALRLQTAANPSCRYTLRVTVGHHIAPAADASGVVAAALPVASAYILDAGTHAGAAWRVVRRPGLGNGRIHVDARWTTVLSRRADLVPSGQRLWADIRVAATSRSGDECHAGTWRALGPSIGDILATARTTLRFHRPAAAR